MRLPLPIPSATRIRLRIALWAGVALVIVLLLVVVANAIHTRQLTWETVCHLTGGISNTESANIQDIGRVARFLPLLVIYNIKPPADFQDLFRPEVVTAELLNDFYQYPGRFPPNLLAGVDRFGTPYVYEVRLFDQEDSLHVRYEVTIRSVGANRRDEKGAGDDAQRVVDVFHDRSARKVLKTPLGGAPRQRYYPANSGPGTFYVFDDSAVGTFIGNVAKASGLQSTKHFSVTGGTGAETFRITDEGDLYLTQPVCTQTASQYSLSIDESDGTSTNTFTVTIYCLVR